MDNRIVDRQMNVIATAIINPVKEFTQNGELNKKT